MKKDVSWDFLEEINNLIECVVKEEISLHEKQLHTQKIELKGVEKEDAIREEEYFSKQKVECRGRLQKIISDKMLGGETE